MKRSFYITSCFILFIFSAKAQTISTKGQTKYNEAEFKTRPVWIIMMDDSAVNYYQAVRAFNIYWKDRIMPDGDADTKDEKENRKEEKERKRYEKKLSKMSPAERNEFDRINYECKRFKNWMHQVEPFVQADGRILTRQQRVDIRNKQQVK